MKTAPRYRFTYTPAQLEMFDGPDVSFVNVYAKGRRAGATRGGATFVIETQANALLQRKRVAMLWGDTIAGNIDRYFWRYFFPVLKRNRIPHTYNKQQGLLVFGSDQQSRARNFIDFRSADRPENWEGFGYDFVFLNEAGIILKDRNLYETSVLPMLERDTARVYAFGVPKLLDYAKPSDYVFWELWENAQRGRKGYHGKRYDVRDNPFVDAQRFIDRVASNMTADRVRQEIYGEFVTGGARMVRRENIRRVSRGDVPEGLVIQIGVDPAISVKSHADFFALVVLGLHQDSGRLFVLDVVRERLGFYAGLQKIVHKWDQWKPKRVHVEEVAFQMAITEHLAMFTGVNMVGVNPSKLGDKVERFQPIATRYERGLVYHVDGLVPEFEDDLLAFPTPRVPDDVCDALAYAYKDLQNHNRPLRFTWI